MWFLKRLNSEEVYYLLAEKQYTVGRKNTDILISNDPSISRNHAVFRLSYHQTHLHNQEGFPILTIKDVGSKYGTFINDSQKLGSETVTLESEDKITFGQCNSSFQLFHESIVITTSCMEKNDKEQLKILIQTLGGQFLPEWSTKCTHLVMKELKVTIKAVCAMVSLKPLVTKEYFENLIHSVNENKNLPDPKSYLSLLGEPALDRETATFHCKKERQFLFQNKIFICTSPKQFKKLQLPIKLAGGKVILLEAENEVTNLILNANTCVMKYQSDSSQTTQCEPHYITKIEEELRRNKKRLIPESDIGLAVVYCSTERYCNADFNMGSSLFDINKLHSQTLSQQDVYVADTQVFTARSSLDLSKPNCGSYVSDTLERTKHEIFNIGHQNNNLNPLEPVSQKRARNCIESDCPAKQIKLENITIKTEDCSSADEPSCLASKDGQFAKTQKLAAKIESAAFCDKSVTLQEDGWNDSSFSNPNQSPAVVITSTMNTEEQNDSSLVMKSEVKKVDILDRNPEPQPEKGIKKFFTSVDGFLSKISNQQISTATITSRTVREDVTVDEGLPSKLLRVEFASLCVKRNIQPRWITNDNGINSSIKNFKKFHKVYSVGNKLPVIIGGRDLIVYNRNSSKGLNNWLSSNPDTQSQENEEIGLFDWDSNKRSR